MNIPRCEYLSEHPLPSQSHSLGGESFGLFHSWDLEHVVLSLSPLTLRLCNLLLFSRAKVSGSTKPKNRAAYR